MAAKGTMKISVIGDASKFDRAMGNVQSKLSKVGAAAAKFGKVAAAGIAGAGAAAVAGAFKMSDYANEVDRAARESGMAAEKIQVTAQAMERLGVDREKAVDGMRELNLRLGEAATEGGDAAEGFKSLGVNLRDAEGNIRNSGAVMDEVMAKLGNMPNQADRAAASAKIFGDEAGFAFAGVASEGDKLEKAMGNVRESGAVMSQDGIDQAQKFQKGWESVKQSALGLLQTGLTPLMGWMAESLFPFIQNKIVPALSDFRDWIGPRLTAAAEQIGEFITGTLVPAFQRLSAWWDANGPSIIATAQSVGETIVGFAQSSHKHVTAFAGAVSSAISTVIGWFQSSGSEASETSSRMQSVFGQLLSTTKTVWNAISTVIGTVIDQVSTVVRATVAVIQAVWERWGTDIKAFARTVFNAILNIIDGILQTISGVFEVFAGLFTGDWERAWNGVKDIFAGILNIIEGLWEVALAQVELALTVFRDTLKEVWSALWTWAKDFVSDRIDDVVGFVRSLPGWAIEALSNAWGAWQAFWREKFQAIADFVSDRVDDVVGFFADLPGNAKTALAEAWDTIASFVQTQFEGLKTAAVNRGEDIVDWFADLPDKIIDSIGNLGSKVGGWISDQLGGLGDIAIDIAGSVGDGPGFGVPGGSAGGSAADRARQAAQGLPIVQTSGYRTPAENRAAGGSPTSYHLDKSNPATDWDGPTWALDVFAARLREMGNWRELLWRVPGHAPGDNKHVHVAHSGGMATPQGIKPLRADEVVAKLKAGETVRTREQEAALHRGGGVVIERGAIQVNGSLIHERELVDQIGEQVVGQIRRKTGMRD